MWLSNIKYNIKRDIKDCIDNTYIGECTISTIAAIILKYNYIVLEAWSSGLTIYWYECGQ